jgi:hypothetical protein
VEIDLERSEEPLKGRLRKMFRYIPARLSGKVRLRWYRAGRLVLDGEGVAGGDKLTHEIRLL